MRKTTIALCLGEREYQERFEHCWMNHYKHQYDVYLFSEIQELLQADIKDCKVILTDIVKTTELEKLKQLGIKIVVLWEKESDFADIEEMEDIIFTAKFQELYKIEEEVKHQIRKDEISHIGNGCDPKDCKVVGIFSLDCESMQMPFSALAACEYGEKTETLLINLQAYSGFVTEKEEVEVLGMEDLMTMSTTEAYSRGRLFGTIGHEQNWDYIYPTKNAEFISEGDGQLYQKIVGLMIKEFNYQTIIINFGTVFSGISELFERCDEFYLLVSKENNFSWREREFQTDLERKEKNAFIQQIKRIEIPSAFRYESGDWRSLMQKWRWSEIGDKLRKYVWVGL